MYEPPVHQISMWGDFKTTVFPNASASVIIKVNAKQDSQSEETSQGTLGPCNNFDQEATKPVDKVLRRLAQNREAARKSRLRKKAYVQQLESSRLKLLQLEQELERARQQNAYLGGGLDTIRVFGTLNSGIGRFEVQYQNWVEVQNQHVLELRSAVQTHLVDIELRMLVDMVMNHYYGLFRMKAVAAKSDVFYLMSGMWKTSAERFFMWIGGFRPSDLLKVLVPHLDLLDQQKLEVCNLKQSCQQAEEALSQGMDKLQQFLADNVASDQLSHTNYNPREGNAMENLEALVCFVNQADHLRQETLQQMSRILTIRQAAQGLLALGEYCHRLRALTSLWATRVKR